MSAITGGRPGWLVGARSAPGSRALKVAGAAYLAGYLAHSVDHVARGLDLTPPAVFWLGTAGLVPAVAVVALAFLDGGLAPALAVLAGSATAVAAALIHVPPYWSAFSEPFRANVGVLDWLSLAAMAGTAAAFVAVGALTLRARRR